MTGKEKFRSLVTLVLTFLKIGAFTFGGGYAMIALLEDEFVGRKKWLSEEEFLNMTAIAESTPGPVAVNSATYIGYRLGGVPGAALATLAVCLPSFCVIYAISLFFEQFLSLRAVQAAFSGVKACVVYLILTAGVRIFRASEKNAFSLAVTGTVFAAMLGASVFAVRFSSILCILACGAAGIASYLIRRIRGGGK